MFLGGWLVLEYVNNLYLQTYTQQVLQRNGYWIVYLLVILAAASTILAIRFRREGILRRLQILAIGQFVLISFLAAWLRIEYLNNEFLQAYLAQNLIQLIGSALGTVGVAIILTLSLKKDLTLKSLVSLIRARSRSYDTAAFVSYLVLTLVFTYPLVLHIGDSVMWGSPDLWHTMWNMWWVKQSLTSGGNLYFSNIMLYPTGVPVTFQPFSFINSIPAILLQQVFGLVTTYNLLVLQSYLLSGLGMYFLVRYLTGQRTSAFLSGIVFMFSPQHEAQSFTHLNLMTQQWLPVYALFMIKMLRESKLRNSIYAATALFATAISDLHFLWFSIFLTVLFLFYALWKERNLIWNRGFVRRLLLMVSLALIVTVATYWSVLTSALFSVTLSGAASIQTATRFSPDLLAFVVPGPLNSLLGPLTTSIYAPIPVISQRVYYVYAGWTVIALSIFAVLTHRKKEVSFWALGGSVFFLLSLGPVLHIEGLVTQIPLPYVYLFYGVPLFKDIRSPYRFDIGLMMFLAVLVGYGFQKLTLIVGTNRMFRILPSKQFVAILLSGLILAEFFIAPVPLVSARVPSYYDILKHDNSNYAVLEIPFDPPDHVYLYYQTSHGRPLLNGATSRTPPSALIFQNNMPFFRLLHNSTGFSQVAVKDILVQNVNDTDIGPFMLGQYNIRYLIVHRTILTVGGYATVAIFNSTVQTLSKVVGAPIYNDTDTVVYRFQNTQQLDIMKYLVLRNRSDLMLLSGDWAGGVLNNGQRPMGLNGTVQAYSNGPRAFQLQFTANAQGISRILDVYWNGELVGQYLLPTRTFTSITIPIVQARDGSNTLSFVSPNGCTSTPSNVCVSFSFRAIQMIAQT